MLRNSKWWLSGDRNETVNHLISEFRIKRIENKTQLAGKWDPLGIVQEIKIWPHLQMVYAQTRIRPGEWDAQNSLGFWDINIYPYSGRKTRRWWLLMIDKRREPAEMWTLPFWLITKWKSKKTKRETSVYILLENWKRYGTWKRRWYQL